jgi:hypothetical protein
MEKKLDMNEEICTSKKCTYWIGTTFFFISGSEHIYMYVQHFSAGHYLYFGSRAQRANSSMITNTCMNWRDESKLYMNT